MSNYRKLNCRSLMAMQLNGLSLNTLINKNKNITEIQRIHYLRASLSIALESIGSLDFCPLRFAL